MVQITNWEKKATAIKIEGDYEKQKETQREQMSESKKIGRGKIN